MDFPETMVIFQFAMLIYQRENLIAFSLGLNVGCQTQPTQFEWAPGRQLGSKIDLFILVLFQLD